MQEDDKMERGWERKSVSLLEKKGQLIGEGDLNVGYTCLYIGCC